MELVAVKAVGEDLVGKNHLFIKRRFSLVHGIIYVLFIWKSHEGNFWSYMRAHSPTETRETHAYIHIDTDTPPQDFTGVSHFVHRQRHHPLRGTYSVKSAFKTQSHRGTHMFPAAGRIFIYFFYFCFNQTVTVYECLSSNHELYNQAWGHMGNLPGPEESLPIVWLER